MNYLMSFCIIVLGTIFAALQGDGKVYWLLVSDCNVAVALFIAWLWDGKKCIKINILYKDRELKEQDDKPSGFVF